MKDRKEEILELKDIVVQKKILIYPTLTRETIDSFNAEYGVHLPDEYALFLTEIGDGWKKTRNDKYATVNMNQLMKSFENGDFLKKEFPFKEAWLWEEENETSARFETEDEETYQARIQKLEEATQFGHITLIDMGSGGSWDLIITGPCKGQVWFICGEGITPCKERLTFFGWLRMWLDYKRELADYL